MGFYGLPLAKTVGVLAEAIMPWRALADFCTEVGRA